MMNRLVKTGFYGKLPALGDFVSRRLPRHFIDNWDQWLQSAIAASREQLGASWLEVYLTSPIWRFGLGAGVCGVDAWAGILMPSVDKVGRYYPLTLAAPVTDPQNVPYLFHEGCAWFEALEKLALSGLEDDFDLDEFDSELQKLALPTFGEKAPGSARSQVPGAGKFALHFEMESPNRPSAVFMGLSGCLLDRFLPIHSLWSMVGSEEIKPSFLICDGLPPIDAFVALMTGQWQQRGWTIQTRNLPVLPGVASKTREANELDPPPLPERPASDSGHWLSHGISVVGKRRKINEDAFIERPDIGLWAVADGMGGHQAGDVASRAIVEALAALPAAADLDESVGNVESALQRVNTELCELARQSSSGQLIGSTVVVLLAMNNRCACLWAGDSRLYRHRSDRLEQLTRDHSLVDDLSHFELLTPEQRAGQGHCNVITRAVGADPMLALDLVKFDVLEGDDFLLCSDGLDKEASSAEIEEILGTGDCRGRAESLIALAMDRGARDNVTVIVVEAPS
ncbi:type VI secretion system-associated protein TagF [Methylocaldum sp.]|uniref:type VI secretion system-associated protein TagF n=1 Tax=Methylocaldum sp. TaxID=1969727 RepID=UPI002D62B5BE|nr:type VI secretion system-associated protein TagF [Methylocaldum sp.]HYE34290.1 type VI secretion system-associated protein TagF [Methylocaldum sp.]